MIRATFGTSNRHVRQGLQRVTLLCIVTCAACSAIEPGLADSVPDAAAEGTPELSCRDVAGVACAEAELSRDDGGEYLGDALCVLTALRDYRSGPVQFAVGTNLRSDRAVRETLVLRQDGRVLRQTLIDGERSGISTCGLADSFFFAECVDAPAARCLDTSNWVVGCELESDASCQAGSEAENR